MKKFLTVLLFCAVPFLVFAGPTNFGRIVLGEGNYGSDPNPTADITGANDNYLANDTAGVWLISATRTRVSGNLHIAGEIAELDSLLGALVMKSTLKVIGTLTASGEVDVAGSVAIIGNIDSVNNITKMDSIVSAFVCKGTVTTVGEVDIGGNLAIVGNIDSLNNVTKIDSIVSALVCKGTVKAVGEVDIGGSIAIVADIDSVNNIVKIDSVLSGIVAKSTLKVVGITTLSNVTADSITSAVVAKSTLKVVGVTTLGNAIVDTITSALALKNNLTFHVKTDSIKGDVVMAEDSVRLYKDTYAKWVPQCLNAGSDYNMQIQSGVATALTAVGKDTLVFAAAYTADPIVTISLEYVAGAETVFTANIDSVGLTAAYVSFRQIAPKVAGQVDSLQITETPAKVIKTHWISVGK